MVIDLMGKEGICMREFYSLVISSGKSISSLVPLLTYSIYLAYSIYLEITSNPVVTSKTADSKLAPSRA